MYTLQQQVFTLSMLSNSAMAKRGMTQAQLEAFVISAIDASFTNSQITPYIGTWSTIWGPVVYVHNDDGVADNTMVVFQGTNGGNPVYVVAIAGTNSVSGFDMIDEDRVGAKPVSFPDNTWIAAGTNRGVTILEQMQDAQGRTLQPFLESLASPNATLIFTGHSLGGALSPTLAMDLVFNQKFDLSRWAKVYVYPSAGPTPGNQAFSDLFAKTFPAVPSSDGAPFNVWNQDVVNTFDIVPRAWSDLDSLPTLYPEINHGKRLRSVQWIVDYLTLDEDLTANRYAPLPTSLIPGAWHPVACPSSIPLVEYLQEALYQHIAFYNDTIIPEVLTIWSAEKQAEKQGDRS